MPDPILTIEETNVALLPLIGMPVSLPWQGWGSAICLELGELSPPPEGFRNERGEACVFVEWDWRVESGTVVSFGSSMSRPKIKRGIESLRRSTIAGLEVAGKVPELEVEFSSGHRLRTMVMTAGRPQWFVRLPDRRYLSADDLAAASEADEARRAEWEKSTESGKRVAARWGRPVAEPKSGRCEDCIFFTGLDGEGYLIEYGVCAWRRSPFDGRVVSTWSGCPEFRPPR